MYDPILLLEIYLPSIFGLLRPHVGDLEKLRSAYSAREKLVIEATRKYGSYVSEGTIFDLWWRAREGNQDSKALLDFIDRTIESLLLKIPHELRSPVRTLCKQMLFKYDDLHSEYTRHLAELAVIELFVRSGKFQLKHIEWKLPNGRTADFLVTHATAEGAAEEFLFEVYMIDFFNIKERIESSEDLKRFLDKRLADKYSEKTYGIDLKSIPPLALVPVLRGELNQLLPFEEGISWVRATNLVADPYVFASRREKGDIRYHFVKAREFFDQVRKQGLSDVAGLQQESS